MNAQFLRAVVDTLLPGGQFSNGVSAPPASTVGGADFLQRELRGPISDTVQRIETRAGGEAAFTQADHDLRTMILRHVQETFSDDFSLFATAMITFYYEHPLVIEAYHWRVEPPQPRGHQLATLDDDLLAPVRMRGSIWREE